MHFVISSCSIQTLKVDNVLSVFVDCIIYADDILILSCSCHGIQRLVDICMDYGKTWDMCFNAKKTQCITFGGNTPKILMLV